MLRAISSKESEIKYNSVFGFGGVASEGTSKGAFLFTNSALS